MSTTPVPPASRADYHAYIEGQGARLAATIAAAYKADIPLYRDMPVEELRARIGPTLQLLFDDWLNGESETSGAHIIQTMGRVIERGVSLDGVLRMMGTLRRAMERVTLEAAVAGVDGAALALEFFGAIFDQAIQATGALYESRLRRSIDEANSFRLIVETSYDAVVTVDQSGTLSYANQAAVSMFGGREPADLVGTPALERFSPSDVARFQDDVWPQMREHGYWRDRLWMVRLNGERFLSEMVSFVLRNAAGHSIGIGAVARDITAEHTAAQQREAMQRELLRIQEQQLTELSAPLIPLDATTLVVPLIGGLDEARMQTIGEMLLRGIAERQVRVVIIDITGVPALSAVAANALVRAAAAVQLLGARLVVTGVKPEVAQTLVALDIDLAGIEMRSSLQSGIAFALRSRRS